MMSTIIGSRLEDRCATSEGARVICRLNDIFFALSHALRGCTNGHQEARLLWDAIQRGHARLQKDGCMSRSTFAEAERLALEVPTQVFNALLREQKTESEIYPFPEDARRRKPFRDRLALALANIQSIMHEVKIDTVTNPPVAGVEPCPTIRALCQASAAAAHAARGQTRLT
jgi:hypothetical protein